MASYYPSITDEQAELIRNASMFFVATVDSALARGPHGVGPVNVSPKGGVPLHILGPNRVAYLDYGGSGNETARHSQAGGPITVMVCSFEAENAAIVRLYGKASVTPLKDSPVSDLLLKYPAANLTSSTRQVVEIEIESTATSCGYGVPVMKCVRGRQVADRGRRYKNGAAKKPAEAAAESASQKMNVDFQFSRLCLAVLLLFLFLFMVLTFCGALVKIRSRGH